MSTKLTLLLACIAVASANLAAGKLWYWKPTTQLVTAIGLVRSSLIVGGTEATPDSYPYLVELFIDDTYFCSGSLISNEWVMTAAHCIDGAAYVSVVMGAQNILQDESTQITMTSTDFFTHENWSSVSLTNDIALIRLPSPVTFSEDIQAIDLPSSDVQEGDLVTIIVRETPLDSTTRISAVLEVTVPVISNEDCNAYYPIVGNGVVCVSNTGSTCGVISGDPLIKDDETYGIASFGASAECEAGYPYAFTRVHYYLDWIEAKTGVTP